MFLSLNHWFSHIKKIHKKRMALGLDRVGVVASRLSIMHFSCPVITVAGTNGKGSTVKTLESIYSQAGYKTALYTSPHLLSFNERIRIENQDIDDDALMHAFEVIENARQTVILSFFEFTTLAALYLFQKANCDVIILEAGLGGRLDAVNIVESDVAVVTSIALDHMDWLGDTRESIAYEKACIARAEKPFICGDEDPPKKVSETAREKKAIVMQIHDDFSYCVNDKAFSYRGKNSQYLNLPLPRLKPQNIATAIAAISALHNKLPISENNIAKGITKTVWSGRFEMIETPLPCVLDVAHNPHAAHWLREQYQQLAPVKNTIGVVGMLKDKAMIETVSALLPCIDIWYVCSLLSDTEERGSDGAVIAEYLQTLGIKNCYTFPSVAHAMPILLQAHCQQQCDRALIFGSFYTVAAAKRFLLVLKGENQWKKKQNND